MDGSSKRIGGGGDDKPSPDHDQNASPNVPPSAAGDGGASATAAAAPAAGRRPFTSLSQEEADLALARVLQEQVSAGHLAGSVSPGAPDRSPVPMGAGACYETSHLIPRARRRSGRT